MTPITHVTFHSELLKIADYQGELENDPDEEETPEEVDEAKRREEAVEDKKLPPKKKKGKKRLREFLEERQGM